MFAVSDDNSLTAPLVLEAFQRYDNGDKMVEIVNFLNDKGVRNMLGGKMCQRQAAQGLQQKDRAERMAGRAGRPGNHEADSG